MKETDSMIIREAKAKDAAGYLNLYDRINSETDFMLLEAGEIKMSASDQAKRFEQTEGPGSGVTMLAETEEELVGFALAGRQFGRRHAHVLYIVVGVLQRWTGRGVGNRLMRAIEHWALDHDFHRLELMVHVRNARAIALYERLGYHHEGVRRHASKIDGEYVDLLYMAKLIGG